MDELGEFDYLNSHGEEAQEKPPGLIKDESIFPLVIILLILIT